MTDPTFQIIAQDLQRYYRDEPPGFWRRVKIFVQAPGLRAVVYFRLNEWRLHQTFLLRAMLHPVCFLVCHRIKTKWGIEIHRGAQLGPGFIIFHYGGIFIDSKAVFGKNCQIAHNVTVGVGGPGRREGVPTFGDNVSINPGAQIYGKIRVGNNVRIGPNTVVNTDIPDDAIVHHLPMRVVVFPRRPAPPSITTPD